MCNRERRFRTTRHNFSNKDKRAELLTGQEGMGISASVGLGRVGYSSRPGIFFLIEQTDVQLAVSVPQLKKLSWIPHLLDTEVLAESAMVAQLHSRTVGIHELGLVR